MTSTEKDSVTSDAKARRRLSSRMLVPAALMLAVALFVPAAGAQAAGGSPVIEPRPGERVTAHPVRIVVRAGPESDDVTARLNGVSVGADFTRTARGRRVLEASNSHGLRHGENVLRVIARKGIEVKRSTVRFRVAHKRPMAGAGRDISVPVGARTNLKGKVTRRAQGPRPRKVRWRVVRAPKQSRILGARGRGGPGAARALRGTGKRAPVFRPDALGRYVLELRVQGGGRTTTDRLQLASVPATTLMPVDTTVERGSTVYGIRIGGDVYEAPPLYQGGGESKYAGSSPTWSRFTSLWQVLVLDRRTLALHSNTTYGYCRGGPGYGICQKGDNGEPFLVLDPNGGAPAGSADALQNQIAALGQDEIVVASAHYDGHTAWSAYNQGSFNTGFIAAKALSAAGFPANDGQGLRTGDSAALIGVPGAGPGAGDFSIVKGTKPAQMLGYLSLDSNDNFDYIPRARQPFDTRAAGSCTPDCTLKMTVGGQELMWPGGPNVPATTITGTMPDGRSGYVVAVLDGHDLSLVDSGSFATQGGPAVPVAADVQKMTAMIESANARGDVVMINSMRTSGAPYARTIGFGVPDTAFIELTKAVAEAGGTKHGFNTSASSANIDYSLVGSGGGEGAGAESVVPGARVRGALAPNNRSLFEPTNVSTDPASAPADRLSQLLLMPTQAWPSFPSAGAAGAFAAIGRQVEMTSNPRATYPSLQTAAIADSKISLLIGDPNTGEGGVTYEQVQKTCGCTEDEFKTAHTRLYEELKNVKLVRAYLAELSQPYLNVSANSKREVDDLRDYLDAELNDDDELPFNPLGFIEGLLDFAGAALGDPELGEQIDMLSATVLMAESLEEGDWSGSSPVEDDPVVRADEFANHLIDQADDAVKGYGRMGDIIVSDPAKLAEVAKYQNCSLPCDGPPFDQYATPQLEKAVELTDIALQRTIHIHLVGRAFGIYDLGLTADPNPATLDCGPASNPFGEPDGPVVTRATGAGRDINDYPAPRRSWATSLDEWHPSLQGSRVRVRIMVHKSYSDYSWPDKALLDRMFNPVNEIAPNKGGLAMDRRDYLREVTSEFVPAHSWERCEWPDGG